MLDLQDINILLKHHNNNNKHHKTIKSIIISTAQQHHNNKMYKTTKPFKTKCRHMNANKRINWYLGKITQQNSDRGLSILSIANCSDSMAINGLAGCQISKSFRKEDLRFRAVPVWQLLPYHRKWFATYARFSQMFLKM